MLASLLVVASMVVGGFAQADNQPPIVNQGEIKQCGAQQYYEQAVRTYQRTPCRRKLIVLLTVHLLRWRPLPNLRGLPLQPLR